MHMQPDALSRCRRANSASTAVRLGSQWSWATFRSLKDVMVGRDPVCTYYTPDFCYSGTGVLRGRDSEIRPRAHAGTSEFES
jgi:hypothetical protein